MKKSFWTVFGLGCGVFALAVACETLPQASDRICTAKANVFCRCEDQSQGTKRCNDDQKSFAECKCDSSNGGDGPVFSDDGGGFGEIDSGPVDKDAPKIDNVCKGKIGLVAGLGGETDLDLFAAAYDGDGAFKVVKSRGPALRGPASVVPILGLDAPSFLAVWQTRLSALASSSYTAGTWSAPESIGLENPASSVETPTLIPFLTKIAVLAYQSAENNIDYERSYGTTGWVDIDASVRPITTATDTKKGPALAVVSGKFYSAYITATSKVVVVTKGSNWASNAPVTVAPDDAAYPFSPALVALETSPTRDLLLVYFGSDQKLHYSVRTTLGQTWSTPKVIDQSASPMDGMTLAAITKGGAMVAWRGANRHGFTSQYDASKDTWAASQEITTPTEAELASVPSVATARCGDADAIVAYTVEAGGVGITRFAGGAAQGPYSVGGIDKASWIGVGESP